MRPFCAAIDWGTSNFRLWLLDDNGGVIDETSSADGIMQCGIDGFERVTESHLAKVSAPADLPVIISGMAGSRQGWAEARYLDTPAALDDIVRLAVPVPNALRTILILPGIAQRDVERPDVMRGEETQLIGVANTGDMLACIPGTHSKWVRVNAGRVTEFSTFLTGEFYSVISRNTILRHAVDAERFDDDVFEAAVIEALRNSSRLTALLFSIRAGQLLGFTEPGTGAARLSGLLIGTEIAAAIKHYGSKSTISLVASGKLASLYKKALSIAEISVTVHDALEASRRGLWIAAQQSFSDHPAVRKLG